MNLAELLKEDLKASLRSGARERAGALRLLLAEIHNKEKEKFGGNGGTLADDEVIAVLQKEAKKRREASELFRRGQRNDLADKENAEIKIIEGYLPRQLSQEEVLAVVKNLSANFKDFNSLMREAMKELKGRADGKLVSELIKETLK